VLEKKKGPIRGQVGILNRPKDQFWSPYVLTQAVPEKSARVLLL